MARKTPLREQVIVVTGASSGLGRAVARLAGRRGAKVVVTARNSEALDACVRELEAFGSEALAVAAAREFARAGDVVLLSPACASFAADSGYAARGDDFATEVQRLADQEANA